MTFPRPEYMRMALALARRGAGRTSPNPAVGAVLVRGGKVVGRGYHRAAGLPHAEVEAIRAAGRAARGADLYVTLEPCCHVGRTGPCTEAVLSAGIRRVAAAMKDPNPAVSGKGLAALRKAGLDVACGLLEEKAMDLNRPYCRWVVSGKPFVTLKLAISLDGQIAASTGASRWISGEESRRIVHRMRAESDAVLVGGGTLRKDDPLLSSRVRGGRDPIRIAVTSRLSGVSDLRIFRGGKGRVLFICPRGASGRHADRVASLGGRVLELPSRKGLISAGDLLRALGREGVTSLLVEGGGRVAGWLVSAGAVDRYVFFIAPRLLGEGTRAIAGFRPTTVDAGKKLAIREIRRAGEDLVVTAEALRERGG